jgi:hypothetical protein
MKGKILKRSERIHTYTPRSNGSKSPATIINLNPESGIERDRPVYEVLTQYGLLIVPVEKLALIELIE